MLPTLLPRRLAEFDILKVGSPNLHLQMAVSFSKVSDLTVPSRQEITDDMITMKFLWSVAIPTSDSETPLECYNATVRVFGP